jgi:type IV secretion system protein TrbL
MNKSNRRNCFKSACVAALITVLLLPRLGWGDTAPSSILNQYAGLRGTWIDAVSGFARDLFGLLALIEFAWSAAALLLERSDFQSWTAGVVHKLMWIGAFYTLLLFGPTWIPAIVDSFIAVGQRAAGTGALAPGDVYTRGLAIAGTLLKGSSDAGFFTNFGSALALVLAAFLVFGAFLLITIQFVVALVESYIVVSAGFIFLGFGGSRWTAPYVERYIGLAVSVGTKIMVLYLLVGSGMALSDGWLNAAVNVPGTPSPSMSALDIVGAAVIFTAVCWQAPKLISGVIGGSPVLTGGDLISTVTSLAGAAYFAGSVGAAGGRAIADRITGSSGQGPTGGGGPQGQSPSGGPPGSSGGKPPGTNGAPGGSGTGGGSPQPVPPTPNKAGTAGQVSPPTHGAATSGATPTGKFQSDTVSLTHLRPPLEKRPRNDFGDYD